MNELKYKLKELCPTPNFFPTCSMQKSTILIVISLLGFLQLSGQEGWQTEEIDEWFGVSFPGVAQQTDTFGQRLLYLEQDSVVFFVSKAEGKTPNVTDLHRLEEYYDGLVNGFVDQTGARLVDESAFALGGLKGREIRVEYSYSAPQSSFGPLRDSSSDIRTDVREIRFLLLKEHTYVQQFWYTQAGSEAKLALGKQFFDSFQSRKEIMQNMQFVEKEWMEDGLKPWLGETVLYGGLVLLIVFVYMLGRYVAKNQRL